MIEITVLIFAISVIYYLSRISNILAEIKELFEKYKKDIPAISKPDEEIKLKSDLKVEEKKWVFNKEAIEEKEIPDEYYCLKCGELYNNCKCK